MVIGFRRTQRQSTPDPFTMAMQQIVVMTVAALGNFFLIFVIVRGNRICRRRISPVQVCTCAPSFQRMTKGSEGALPLCESGFVQARSRSSRDIYVEYNWLHRCYNWSHRCSVSIFWLLRIFSIHLLESMNSRNSAIYYFILASLCISFSCNFEKGEHVCDMYFFRKMSSKIIFIINFSTHTS